MFAPWQQVDSRSPQRPYGDISTSQVQEPTVQAAGATAAAVSSAKKNVHNFKNMLMNKAKIK